MDLKTLAAAAALALLLPLPALAGVPVDVEIRDHTTGDVLPAYWQTASATSSASPGGSTRSGFAMGAVAGSSP